MNSNSTASLVEDQFKSSSTNTRTTRRRTPSVEADGLNAVAFFPGLGSRSAYRDIDQDAVEAN